MKLHKLLYLSFLLVLVSQFVYSQERPSISAQDLIELSETDFNNLHSARTLAMEIGIPYSIYLRDGVFIDALGVENEKPVFLVMQDITNPFEKSYTAFYDEIKSSFNLENARMHFGKNRVVNSRLGIKNSAQSITEAIDFFTVVESTNDLVIKVSKVDGSILDTAFIVDPINLATPIQCRLNKMGNYTISDQLGDAVFQYDASGSYLSILAPAGGLAPDTINNVRGLLYRDFGNLLATVASGANSDAIAEFDQSGNYIGNFIEPNSLIMDSPWDVIIRSSDVLVSASSSDGVHRYDLSGTYLDDFATLLNFPYQMAELDNGDIAVCNFSGTESGIYFYSPAGVQKKVLNVVTGVRGVAMLGNGNVLTTTSAGIFALDSSSGIVVDTIAAGISARYITPIDLSIVPVELMGFSAEVFGSKVELTWSTATETNNAGFEIERKELNNQFEKIGYVDGNGTTSEITNYKFVDETAFSNNYSYRLKQIDFNGTFEYSHVVEVDLTLPNEFSLKQNYPNPFNPSTTIEFSLPVQSNVSASVYSLLGEKVFELNSNEFEAGINRIEFNGRNVTSGIYFYTISAQGIDGSYFNQTKKMLLMK